jgi:quinol monooxygenase YgiN
MPVLIRHRAGGMTMAQYDESAPALVEQVRKQPGFILHVAFEDAQGLCVAELWETKDQHDKFFYENVVPNVPAEITQEVIEIHAMVTPS